MGTKGVTRKSPLEATERRGDAAHGGEAARASCWAAGEGQTPGIHLEELQVFIFYANERETQRDPKKSRTASCFSGVIKRWRGGVRAAEMR